MYGQFERPHSQCSSLYPVLRALLSVCAVSVVSALDKNRVLAVASMYDTLNSSDASPQGLVSDKSNNLFKAPLPTRAPLKERPSDTVLKIGIQGGAIGLPRTVSV